MTNGKADKAGKRHGEWSAMPDIDPRRTEDLSLEKATMHLLEECRMVLPGIQMTFGFQLVVFFNDGFRKLLGPDQRLLHLAAMTGVALSAAIVMAPAAFHRHVEPLQVSGWLLRLGSQLLMWSMLPLALGLCTDLYLLASTVTTGAAALIYSAAMFIVFMGIWFIIPLLIRRFRTEPPA